eukprot:scaffold6422_cov350-Prasinococcus_capsulatus_cf.AAC.3
MRDRGADVPVSGDGAGGGRRLLGVVLPHRRGDHRGHRDGAGVRHGEPAGRRQLRQGARDDGRQGGRRPACLGACAAMQLRAMGVMPPRV